MRTRLFCHSVFSHISSLWELSLQPPTDLEIEIEIETDLGFWGRAGGRTELLIVKIGWKASVDELISMTMIEG
jgi:hypothetical protein